MSLDYAYKTKKTVRISDDGQIKDLVNPTRHEILDAIPDVDSSDEESREGGKVRCKTMIGGTAEEFATSSHC